MPARSISDEFNDSYAQQGLQPSTGGRGVVKYPTVEYDNKTTVKETAGTALRLGGVGVQQSGRAMQVGGRGLQRGGSAIARSGAALSSTGLGAIVGVPLIAVGAATAGVGTGLNVSGKATEKTSSAIDQTGRTVRAISKRPEGLSSANPKRTAKTFKDRAKVTRVSISIFSIGLSIWFSLQLPISFIGLIAFGGTATAIELLPDFLVEWTVGGIFEMTQFVIFAIGLVTLMTMSFVYVFSGINCLFGKGSALKVSSFIFALFGYFMPFLNIFPWFVLWAVAVWRYPK